MKKNKIKFGIVGSGWRSEFYLRIAKMLPEQFDISGIVIRNENKAKEIENKWGVATFRSTDDLMNDKKLIFLLFQFQKMLFFQ